MYFGIELSKDVKKFLSKHEDIARLFYQKIKILSSNNSSSNLDIKPLKWQKNHYRLRIGKYRFLYEIIDDQVLIYFYEADSRWSIYK